MGYKKSNYAADSVGNVSKTTNIIDLIKRNKIEEQKDKLQKIFTLFGFSGLALLFVIFLLL